MSKTKALILLSVGCVLVLVLSMGIGSVQLSPAETLNVIAFKLFGQKPFGPLEDTAIAILWEIRIPRTLLAFISGAGLAVSGVIMQSVLRNPLASSYTLGVSSGAAVGASLVILFSVTFLGVFTLPIFGLAGGLITVFLALGIAAKIDRNMQNNSVILTGMAFSLFANALITIIMALSGQQLQRLVFWQMGSFSMKGSAYPLILFPLVLLGILLAVFRSREMDILTLGDEQAQVSGVEAKKTKWALLSLGAVLTGTVVSMVGIIGFIDLFTPHAARKLFGASHRYVIPASALLGGAFMVLCDLAARSLLSPVELPVGAVTSALGAPFFIYLYFSRRKAK